MKKKRAPIVTVLGHVDHGKTTLLDVIRESNIWDKEAGGITQSIGASTVKTSEGQFTFVDTPGHAAFSKMRERGAKVADMALLVMASDDGVKPQTVEALDYIRNAELPYIVVMTKTDLPSSSVEKAQGQLETMGVLFEGRGGDTPMCSVSAKKKEGIKELLEMIELLASVNDFEADPDGELDAVVVEVKKDKRGVVASMVVRNGTLKIGDKIQVGKVSGKVKGMFDEFGKGVKQVLPGEPVAVLGFSESPEVGARLSSRQGRLQPGKSDLGKGRREVPEVGEDMVAVVIKTGSSGSLEAMLASVPKGVVVVDSGVGDVSESDVAFAKSVGAVIMVFESKVRSQVRKLADTDGVLVEEFKIIYELVKRLEELVEEKVGKVNGRAVIVQAFPYKNKKVAGCKVESGVIAMGDTLRLMREEKEKGVVKVVSLRREKQELAEAKAGEECGVIFEPNLDFDEGDVLLSVANS